MEEKTPLSPPVAQLIRYGNPRTAEWPDYLALGIGPEHVPELIQILREWESLWELAADDEDDHDEDDAERPADDGHSWAAFIHAWRALGQLRAIETLPVLLDVMESLDEEVEWGGEEIPEVIGLLGPAAIDPLAAFLRDPAREERARSAVARAYVEIARPHPAARDRCVAALSDALSRFDANTPETNALLISYLVDLNAAEAAPVIRAAYKAGPVDHFVIGGWGDVRKELKLERLEDDPPDEPDQSWTPEWMRRGQALADRLAKKTIRLNSLEEERTRQRKQKERARAARKQARKSRRANRKRR